MELPINYSANKVMASVALTVIMVAVNCLAQDQLTVICTRDELLTTDPGKTLTVVFIVANSSATEMWCQPQALLPEGWKLVSGGNEFQVPAQSSTIRLLTFHVPMTALSGFYTITYRLAEDIEASAEVKVKPLSKVIVELLEIDEYNIAGETYSADFMVTNESNTFNKMKLEATSVPSQVVKLETYLLELRPGQSQLVTIKVKTSDTANKIYNHRITLKASIFNVPDISASASGDVEIIPKSGGEAERYHKIPGYVALRQVSLINGGKEYDYQGEFFWSGALDEDGKRHLEMKLKGPNIEHSNFFDMREEYRLHLSGQAFEITVGDTSYYLSPLTETRYGRGIEGVLKFGGVRLGSYYQQSIWGEVDEERYAGRIGYSFNEKHYIGLNYLQKRQASQTADIGSVYSRFKPWQFMTVEMEYGLGKADEQDLEDAYMVGAFGRWEWLSYNIRYIHAEPEYPGYYSDIDFVSSGFSTQLGKNLRVGAGYQQTKNNVEPGIYDEETYLERNINGGLYYHFESGTNLSFEYRNPHQEDLADDPEFNIEEQFLRIGIGQSFQTVSLNLYGEYGQGENKITNIESELERYAFSVAYRPTKRQSHYAYARYMEKGDYTAESSRRVSYEVRSHFLVGSWAAVQLDVQTEDNLDYAYRNRDMYGLKTTFTLPNENEISVIGRHLDYRKTDELDGSEIMLEYRIPFKMPVHKKRNLGRVKGFVYDAETEKPIKGAILRINGSAGVTDNDGKFDFQTLKTGDYLLQLQTERIGLDKVTTVKTPLKITVKEKETQVFRLGVIREAKLTGRVVQYCYKQNGKKQLSGNSRQFTIAGEATEPVVLNNAKRELVPIKELHNILIELINCNDKKRRLTGKDGSFKFESLCPGPWKLKVYPGNLPEYHYVEQEFYEFELTPGEHEEVEIRVLPRQRQIRIIGEGGVLEEK